MSVTITIGEKFLNEETSPPIWDVRRVTSPYAPKFPNDAILDPEANWRFVNYPAWEGMAEEVGLVDLLIHPETGLLRTSEVVLPVTEAMYRQIIEACLLRSAFAEGQAGWALDEQDFDPLLGSLSFAPATQYDEYYARLIWLRFLDTLGA